jgi:hypothetical protein
MHRIEDKVDTVCKTQTAILVHIAELRKDVGDIKKLKEEVASLKVTQKVLVIIGSTLLVVFPFVTDFLKKILFPVLVLFIVGCASDYTAPRSWELTSLAYMPFSEQLTHSNRVDYVGVATLPRQSSRTLVFRPRYQPRDFMIFTCGREHFIDNPTREIRYVYTPLWGIERDGACPLFAVSISNEGKRETAVVDFNNGYSGKARVYCNGNTIDANGAHLCQIRSGLFVGLRFDKSMVAEADTGCSEPIRKPFYEWEIQASSGHCSYLFADNPNNIFRLTVRGYDSILEVVQ